MKGSHNLRRLDRIVGMPACLLMTGVYKLLPRPTDKRIKRILVIELFEMGAAITLYPSLQYIKENVKDCEIYCLTARSGKGPWEMLNIIPKENIYTIDDTNLGSFVGSGLSNMAKLRGMHFDLIIDYELFMRISAVMAGIIGAKYKAGFYGYLQEGLYRGDFYSQRVQYNQNTHIAKNFLGLTKTAVNLEQHYPNYKGHIDSSELIMPKYKPDKALRKEILERAGLGLGDPVILVDPDVGGNLPMRNYPRDSFAEVIRRLLRKYPKHHVLLTGTKDRWHTCEHIRAKVNSARCINFAGQTHTLKEFTELISGADLLIGNDSGSAHFASITGTKTLALFSTDAPTMYGPLGNCVILYSYYQCSPCISAYNHKESQCTNNLCLQTIKPEAVFEMATRILDGKVEYRTVNGTLRYV